MSVHGNSDYTDDSIMGKFCGVSALPSNFPPPVVCLGVSATVPTKRGSNITEPSGGGYARQPLITSPTNKSEFNQIYPGVYVNAVGVQFPLPTATWGGPQLSLFACDALTGTPAVYPTIGPCNFIAWASQIHAPVQVNNNGASIYFPPGFLRFGIKPFTNRRGGITEWWATQLANWFWNGQPITWPSSLWAALCMTMPRPNDTGSTIIEPPVAAHYSRQTVGSWQQILYGRYGNGGVVAWPFPDGPPPWPTAPWGSPAAWALLDAGELPSSGGNLYFAGHRNNQVPIPAGPPPPMASANQIQIALEAPDL